MIPFILQAQFYSSYHQSSTARYTHMIGVPLIILSLMMLLGFVRILIIGVLDLNLAEITTFVLLGYYFLLNWRLALAVTPFIIFMLWLATFFTYDGPDAFALSAFAIIFIVGCALQFVGHFIEKQRPAFIESLWQVLIAPLCLMAEIFFMAGRMQELKTEIHFREPTNINDV